MPTRPLLPAVLVAVLVFVGCSAPSLDGDVPLVSARLVDGRDDVLEVEFSGCDETPDTTVTESDDVVVVRIHGPSGGCEPIHAQRLELGRPLGVRRIIDQATGREAPAG